MKVSREQAERNREKVVDAASRLFRARGVEGVGIGEVMRECGLTHGGFYKFINFAHRFLHLNDLQINVGLIISRLFQLDEPVNVAVCFFIISIHTNRFVRFRAHAIQAKINRH
mgnify:CR=1 FL=1